eukprot:4040845-Lingulodinium_polyedra.AAC.1
MRATARRIQLEEMTKMTMAVPAGENKTEPPQRSASARMAAWSNSITTPGLAHLARCMPALRPRGSW